MCPAQGLASTSWHCRRWPAGPALDEASTWWERPTQDGDDTGQSRGEGTLRPQGPGEGSAPAAGSRGTRTASRRRHSCWVCQVRRGQEGAAAQTGRSQGEARRLGRGGQPGRRPGPLPGWGGIAQALALSGLFWPLLCLVVAVAVEVAAGGQAWLKGIRSDSRLGLGGVGCPAGVVLCGGCWSVALVTQDQPGWRWWPRQRAGVREGGRYWRGARECPCGWGASARLPRLRLSGLGSWPPTSQGTPSARLPSTVLALAALPTAPALWLSFPPEATWDSPAHCDIAHGVLGHSQSSQFSSALFCG